MYAPSFAIALSALLFSTCAFAITPSDVAKIQPGSQLEIPTIDTDTPTLETISIQHGVKIMDADGSLWYRFNGKRPDQSPAVLIMHIENGHVEVESSIRQMKLRDLGLNAKQLWKIDKQGQGEFVFDNDSYQLNAEESDDAKFVDTNGTQAELSYYRFDNTADDDLALLVFEWSEDRFEVLALEWVEAEKVRLL